MKQVMLILFLLTQVKVWGQDSLRATFSKLYDDFRKENNLPVLKYSEELEQLASERINVVTKEADRCFSCVDWETLCPGINLHFKAISMMKAHNVDTNNKHTVSLENAALYGEFDCEILSFKPNVIKKKKNIFQKIGKFISSIFTSEDSEDIVINYSDIDYGEYKAVKKAPFNNEEIQIKLFESWKGSNSHRRAFENRTITHFGFKYYRTIHAGNPWIHGVWLGGKAK